MLFKNNIQKIKKKPLEFFLFTFFFTFSIFLYVMMNTSLVSMKESFKAYLKKQNVEDFSFTVNKDVNLKEISVNHHFLYEIERKKWIQKKDTLLEVYPYEKNKKINKPYLVTGNFPKKGQITVSDKFAKENNLKIGDTFKIDKKEYQISGYVYHPSLIYMMIAGKIYTNHKEISNIYMNTEDYENLNKFEDSIFIAKYKKEKDHDFFITYLSGEKNPFKELEKDLNFDDTLLRMMSIYYLSLNFELYHIFAKGMFLVFMFLCLFTYLLMFQKRIRNEKRELALLKTMGYSKLKITLSYLIYPILNLIVGLLLGISLGFIFHERFMILFLTGYQLPILVKFKGLNITKILILVGILLIMIMFYILFYLKKDILSLLKEKKHKISFVKRKIKKIFSKLSFLRKIQLSLFLERINISIFAFILSVIVSFFLLFVFIGKDAINQMISLSFKKIHYDYQIMYSKLQEKEREGDVALKEQGFYKKDTIILYGIKHNNQYIQSYDLKQNECIINKTFALKYHIKIKDIIKVTIHQKEYEFMIKTIEENYQDSMIYISFEYLNNILNLKNNYNIRYVQSSNKNKLYEEDVYYIISIDESKQSMKNVFSIFETLIGLLLISSSICLIFLLWFLSQSIVEDHKKNIILFKLLGYSNQQIKKIFFNQYYVIVCLSYLCAIIIIIPFFHYISNALLKENFVFVFHYNLYKFIVSFLLLFVGYLVSLSYAKKSLERYDISELLKREE